LKKVICLLYFLSFHVVIFGGEFFELSLPIVKDTTRAKLLYFPYNFNPEGILILASGYNSDGTIIMEKEWIDFAQENKLILLGLSFASNVEDLKNGRGYYYPSKGSGKLLLDGIKQIYFKEIPIFLYGFSGGAHFVARFAEWVPDRVAGFCAYSAAWWDDPKSLKNAPLGIIACGENDERLGASMSYFLDGRKLNRKWVWVKIPNVGHTRSLELDDFVRDFFKCILNKATQNDAWVDISNGKIMRANIPDFKTALTCYIPCRDFLKKWKKLNGIQ
jgi:hypothetical protein vspiD_18380